MATKDLHIKDARFDTRLTKEQKDFFERAASLGGFRSLTDFIIAAVQKRAKEIISESERVIDSQKDSEIFFEALTNPSSPNKDLIDAANEFKAFFSE
jgi:uncharacterized protein (DUF1778 family)